MAYQPTSNFGWAMPRGGDQAQISVINQQFTAKADEIVYQTRRMIAPGYIDDGTKTYQPGEIVEYENVDYICTGTTSGAWDSSKWDSTDMATQIQEAKESGGTNVEANPVEAATADLHKLKVDTTVYGIPDPTVTKTATGNPIEISDGASAPLVKCTTEIQGSQDLHGYDKPWVGGAGKNKCSNDTTIHLNVTASIGSTGTFGTNNSYDVYYFRTSDYANIAVSCDKTKLNSEIIRVCYSDTIPSNGTTYIRRNNLNPGTYVTVDTTYTYIIFVFFWNDISDKSLIQIENGTVCTDYEPYSNICPITAYTEGEIEVRGKNLFDKNALIRGYAFNQDGEIIDAENFGITPYTMVDGNYLTISGLTYGSTNWTFRACYFDDEKNYLSQNNQIITLGFNTDLTYTLPAGTKFVRFSIGIVNRQNLDTLQIEKGTTATTYEPYVGTTHTTTYPSAIYRGSEDCVNGEVTSEMGIDNGANLTWQVRYTGSVNKTLSTNLTSEYAQTNPGIIAEDMAYIQKVGGASVLSDPDSKAVGIYGYNSGTPSSSVIYIVAPISYTPSSKIIYNLATPTTTSSVTPTNLPIKSLAGYSHIESSTGDMDVEYITEGYQPLVDLIQESQHVYATTEQVVGKWIDGSDVYERTIDLGSFSVGSWSDHTIESSTSINLLIDYDGYMVESNIMYALPDPSVRIKVDESHNLIFTGTSSWNVTSGHLTIRYTKTSSNNRSLSKGATEGLKADLSEVKGEGEEVTEKVEEPVEKTEEPVEEPTEKEENER